MFAARGVDTGVDRRLRSVVSHGCQVNAYLNLCSFVSVAAELRIGTLRRCNVVQNAFLNKKIKEKERISKRPPHIK